MTSAFLRVTGAQHDREPDLTFARAIEDLKVKSVAHTAAWGLDGASWAADLDAGTITFTNKQGWRIVAPVQVIGTFNTRDNSWLWGWDHPSVKPALAEHARLARAFGEKYKLERLTTRKIEASEAECWQFAALACHLAGAQGAYRGPSGPNLVFMTFGNVTITKA